jgi:cytosine/adenosine deaminase-related metal-dependent hydrolase
VIQNLDDGKQADVLIMDFSKAFDKVSHNLLMHQQEHYGIRGILIVESSPVAMSFM